MAIPNVTAHPSTASVPITVLQYNGPLLGDFNMDIKGLMGTIKPQSNGPLYSNTVIGTLAVDGWGVTFGIQRGRDWAGPQPAQQPPPRCTKCNSSPINGHLFRRHIIGCGTIITFVL